MVLSATRAVCHDRHALSGEVEFIALMRSLATHPGARGLQDDAAVLDVGKAQIVLTHDMLIEGVHFLSDDPAETVAWKLVAVNMSDLAAKGATPLGILLGFSLTGNSGWDRSFTVGFDAALKHFGVPLLGGDTVALPDGTPRALGLTAIGNAPTCGAPSRSSAKAGDVLYVSGTIGDAGAGLALLRTGQAKPAPLIEAYSRPMPSLALGQALAPLVSAMADVSDGLLIDASRIAQASGCGLEIDLGAVPLSSAFILARGDSCESRLFAATCGDDYRLIFSIDPAHIDALPELGIPLTCIGTCTDATGLSLTYQGENIPLPDCLGYEHGASIT